MMKKPFPASVAAACLCVWSAQAAPEPLESEADQINYSVGFRVGSDLRDQGGEVSAEMLVKGIQDAVSGVDPLVSHEEMQDTLAELQRRMLAREQAQRQKELARIIEEGEASDRAQAQR